MTMRIQDIATREEISDIIGCARAEFKANIIDRQEFIERLVGVGFDYWAAFQEVEDMEAYYGTGGENG